MNTILGFKNLEDEELDDHPANSKLREQMTEFHDSLMGVMSIGSLETEEEEGDSQEGEEKKSVWGVILKVLAIL